MTTYEVVVKTIALALVLGTPKVWYEAVKHHLDLDIKEWLKAEFDPSMEHHP